jgi:hypothetical protein
MKDFNIYLLEDREIKKYEPIKVKDRKELEKILINCGRYDDLSDIDVSNVTDMSKLFCITNRRFNGNISSWDVSNVTDMSDMFKYCEFDGDISSWNVSNVTDMHEMFLGSDFTGDNTEFSKWANKIQNVTNFESMFKGSNFNGKLRYWKISEEDKKSMLK